MSKFLDNLKENAKTVAEIACRKTGKAVNYSKLKFNAADINRKISNSYEEIGKALYISKKQGIDKNNEISEHIAAIDNLNIQLESLNCEIEQLKNKNCSCKCDNNMVETTACECNKDEAKCECSCNCNKEEK